MTSTRDGDHLVEHLTRLAHEYRHFQQEHEREGLDGATRRGLQVKMQRLAERFELLLSHWAPDEALRQAWTRYLYRGGSAPTEPRAPTPPIFKGVTDSGSRVELRPAADGGYDLLVDGALRSHEEIPWHLDPDPIEPIQIGDYTCREVSEAPPPALEALGAFLETPRAEPPWPWFPALFADGLVDENFALTPRGRRQLAGSAARAAPAAGAVSFGVLAADAARGRVFVLHAARGEQTPTLSPLVEIAGTTSPDQRARDSALFRDTRPGTRRGGPHGAGHGVDDRRREHRRENERRFAAQLLREAVQVWRQHEVTRVVLVASPGMLAVLRQAMEQIDGSAPWSIRELARDLTRYAEPALHDVLAGHGLLPPRGRPPPLQPAPGRPIQ